MRNIATIFFSIVFIQLSISQDFRPPSVPLIAHDPYFSIWSPSDRLYDRETVHWTGRNHPMHSLIRIDGKTYRLMGAMPGALEPVKQMSVKVYPTRTIYEFQNYLINIQLVFTSPALPSDLDLFSRPVTYISWVVKTFDGKPHDVQLYFDCSGEIAVNNTDQNLKWDSPAIDGLQTVRIGTADQPILKKRGDDLRIDWGYAYLSVPNAPKTQTMVGERDVLMNNFISSGVLPNDYTISQPRQAKDGWVAMASTWTLGIITSETTRWAMLAYNDLYSIRYFNTDLRAWWTRNGQDMNGLLTLASMEYEKLKAECASFDADLMKDFETAAGHKYALINALIYRQVTAAHKLVADANGMPLIFSKENFSNGCIATVDVSYPTAPFFFLLSPALTKAMLQPVFDYAASTRWKFQFAPHDLGTYPQATGQIYGGGEESEENQMPVEESGNMIIMTAALAKMEGNASYAQMHWPVIEKWADFLLSKGFDPENQLCTDDFAGHLAHNINLSAKAIIALGSYALLCEMTGNNVKAIEARQKAEAMVKEWISKATEGDHTRLAYDRPGTWSQKYNLVWDKILDLKLFPKEVLQREIQFYKTKQAEFGLPLDNRERYAINTWVAFSATLADNDEDFQAIFNPIYHYAESTPQRVPVSDWYNTDNAFQAGFQARSVVGGLYIKMLADKALWNKWVSKGTNVTGTWAPLKFNISNP